MASQMGLRWMPDRQDRSFCSCTLAAATARGRAGGGSVSSHSLGITAWLDAMAEPPILATYRSLAQNGELTAHVAAFPVVNQRNDPAKELEIVQKERREFAGTPEPDDTGDQSICRRSAGVPFADRVID